MELSAHIRHEDGNLMLCGGGAVTVSLPTDRNLWGVVLQEGPGDLARRIRGIAGAKARWALCANSYENSMQQKRSPVTIS